MNLTPEMRTALIEALHTVLIEDQITPNSVAEVCFLAGYCFGLEQAAKVCKLSRDAASLRAGEFTASEWRAVRVMLNDRARAIRSLIEEANG